MSENSIENNKLERFLPRNRQFVVNYLSLKMLNVSVIKVTDQQIAEVLELVANGVDLDENGRAGVHQMTPIIDRWIEDNK